MTTASFERIVNRPTRGIGARTVEIDAQLRARQQLFDVARGRRGGERRAVRPRGECGVAFLNLIERMARDGAGSTCRERWTTSSTPAASIDFFKKDKGERGETRVENLRNSSAPRRASSPTRPRR